MSLARALAALPADEDIVDAVQDIIVLFSHHAGDWITVEDAAKRVARVVPEVRRVLEALRAAFVLDFDGADSYRYKYDVGVSIEIDRFLHRTRVQKNHVQTNVARFRERYGSFS
ncbi:MAG: hypothetical protein WBI63_07985 [Coriobacteriia bacterium]